MSEAESDEGACIDAAVTYEDVPVLRLLARHGTPNRHGWFGNESDDYTPCDCWEDARRSLWSLRDSGYDVVPVDDRPIFVSWEEQRAWQASQPRSGLWPTPKDLL